MSRFTHRSGYSVEHVLPQQLLKAAVIKDERAIQAWRAWKPLVDEDNLDEGSHRLLPLLYQNLSQLGVDPDELEKYKKVYRFYWYKNQHILSKAIPILQELEQNGIEYLLLKGVPLAFHYYPNPGIRPFGDVDIVVKPSDTLKALAIFEEFKLIPNRNSSKKRLLQYKNSQNFKSPIGLTIDLHWQVLYRDWKNISPLVYWDNPITFLVGVHSFSTLSTSAHFMHACLHGLDWDNIAPVRWAADAAILINEHSELIDWDWVIDQTKIRHLTYHLHHQLRYLQSNLGLLIPSHVFQNLSGSRPRLWEKVETKIAVRPHNLFTKLLGFWFIHYRNVPSRSIFISVWTFPGYILYMLNIRRSKDFFPVLFKKFKEWI